MNDNFYEDEIDLLDLLYKILKNFKKIIIVCVVGLLFGLTTSTLNYKNEIKDVESLLASDKVKLKEYEDSLDKIKSYELLFDEIEDYNKKIDELNNMEIDETLKVDYYNTLIGYKNTIKSKEDSIKSTFKGFNNIEKRYYLASHPEFVEEIDFSNNNLKYSLIGFILGGFIACAYYGMIYLLDGLLHTEDEISYKTFVYGKVVKENCNTKLDKLFKKNKGESLETIVSRIKLDLTNKNINEVVIASTLLNEDEVSDILKTLKKELNVKNVYFDALNNSNFFNECENGTFVILIEKLEKTRKKDIDKYFSLCKNLMIKNLGTVVID